MKYYIIAGEASGDLHGSHLIKELRKRDRDADIRCWGGDLMEAAGATLVKHYRDLAFMGFTEVIRNLPAILRNIKFCKEDISAFRPDVLILIDYPGFNIRIATWAKQNQFKVVYYISPQVWAWKESRVKTIRAAVDKMLVILPFEKSFYKKWDYEVEYVGHPLVDVVEQFKKNHSGSDASALTDTKGKSLNPSTPLIALLPGSRKQEILKKLPVMLKASTMLPGYQFVVAQAPAQDNSLYEDLMRSYSNVCGVSNKTYELLLHSKAACVTSGTATLETALFGVPEVICYKGSPVSYQIARKLIKVKYISLVNLIMDKPVVKELIQDEMTAVNIVDELRRLLQDAEYKKQWEKDYADLKNLLSEGGQASAKAAESIIRFLKPNVS